MKFFGNEDGTFRVKYSPLEIFTEVINNKHIVDFHLQSYSNELYDLLCGTMITLGVYCNYLLNENPEIDAVTNSIKFVIGDIVLLYHPMSRKYRVLKSTDALLAADNYVTVFIDEDQLKTNYTREIFSDIFSCFNYSHTDLFTKDKVFTYTTASTIVNCFLDCIRSCDDYTMITSDLAFVYTYLKDGYNIYNSFWVDDTKNLEI